MALFRCLATIGERAAKPVVVATCGGFNFSTLNLYRPTSSSVAKRRFTNGLLEKCPFPSSFRLLDDRKTYNHHHQPHHHSRAKSTEASLRHETASVSLRSTSRQQISEATFDPDRSRVILAVTVKEDDMSVRERYEFPAIWLRDNCQCERCFHRRSSSRVLDWQTFDVDRVKVSHVERGENGQSLVVRWNEGGPVDHRSVYGLRWLLERNFRTANIRTYLDEWYRPEPIVWGAETFPDVLREFSFSDVLNDDVVLMRWIEALIAYGVVMIKDAPLTEHECRRLAERVGFIRKTHYGEEFIVKAKEGTSNVAYLSTPLQMHTDLPYYDYKPGCNLLHCLVQSTNTVGGENLIADGFHVAEQLRRHHPDDFRLLSETLVDWCDLGTDEAGSFHSLYRAPVICIGRDGRLERINHSVPQRDSHFCVPIDRVEPWYRAMQRFVTVLHREAFSFRTSPGDILTFSNVRMVHGRTGYTDTVGNTRHIVGAYLDWDEIYSKLRVLKASFECNE